MRALTAALQAKISGRVTSFATCWRLTLKNGEVLRGTEHDRDMPIASGSLAGTYLAEFNISGSDLESTSDLAVDNVEVSGAVEQIFGTMIQVADIEAGVLDGASVIVFLADWTDPDAGQVIIRAGYVGQIFRDSNDRYKAEVRGLVQKLSQQIGQNYSEQCNVVRFGDARCTFNVALITQACVITAVESRRRFTADVVSSPGSPGLAALPRGGEVTWTSGANVGFTREVKLMTLVASTFTIDLYEETAADLVVGDLCDVVPGCDRLASTCRFVYDNLINFRGHGLFIPGALAMMRGNLTFEGCVAPSLEDPSVGPGEVIP